MAEYSYRVRIKEDTLPPLQELARNLGFIANKPGLYFGAPSPAAMLDALADAYRLDSGAVIDALRGIGVVNATGDNDRPVSVDIAGNPDEDTGAAL